MNFQNTDKILKVVLSVGDESGIGPEIILKALCSNQIPENIDFILVCSKKNYKIHINVLNPLGCKTLQILMIYKFMILKFLHLIMNLNQVMAIQVFII